MKFPVLLTLLLALGACSDSTSSASSTPKPPPAAAATAATATIKTADIELGRRVYNFRCYFCHGYSGNGQTLAGTYLEPRPRDFSAMSPGQITREQMIASIRDGRPGTAMKGFANILNTEEISAVADFVNEEFIIGKRKNTAYHTVENGWPNHDRYSAAFPFATGKISIDTPPEQLTPQQRAGRKLFMSTCVSCHDRAKVNDEGTPWDARALSYPRMGFQPGDWPPKQVDGITSATPYHLHDKPPKVANLTPLEQKGERLYQQNCAFCHAADGTAKNWIGTFLEPHPRDLTSPAFMQGIAKERLANVIREGLPGTSMPAWKSALSSADIQALIAYISRAFHPVAESPQPAAKR